MARRVIQRPQAERDLIEIWQFIADDNEPAADRLLDRFDRALLTLCDNPQIGRARPKLAPHLRSYPVGKHVVYYRPIERGIEIVRVLSGYLDIQPDDRA